MPNDPIEIVQIPLDDKYVKITEDDIETGYLSDKIVEGLGINIDIINTGGDEQIVISSEGGGGSDDEEFVVELNNATSFPLTITTVSPAGNVTLSKLTIRSVFDLGVSFSVGLDGNEELLMSTQDNIPQLQASYVLSPDIELNNGDIIKVYKSGTITIGEASVLIRITR